MCWLVHANHACDHCGFRGGFGALSAGTGLRDLVQSMGTRCAFRLLLNEECCDRSPASPIQVHFSHCVRTLCSAFARALGPRLQTRGNRILVVERCQSAPAEPSNRPRKRTSGQSACWLSDDMLPDVAASTRSPGSIAILPRDEAEEDRVASGQRNGVLHQPRAIVGVII